MSPQPIAFHSEDLERMVLTRDDLGGLPGFEPDGLGHGFQGNGELETIEVHPEGTCQDLVRFGRVIGFGDRYLLFDASGADAVGTSVHLFWDAAGAKAWTESFVADLKASAGTPLGPTTFEVVSLPGARDGDLLVTHTGPDGTRTWGIVVRGSIVGWVVDLHRKAPTTIDVPRKAAQLAMRIEAAVALAAARPPTGLDVAALASAPLPLAAYGERYADLRWDFFFGGCTDILERGYIAGEEAAADARRFGRVGGCTSMYSPAEGASSPIERVFSSVSVMATEDGASQAVAKAVADMEKQGGRQIGLPHLGDEATGIVTTPGGDRTFTDARAVIRLGSHVLVVALQDREPVDQPAEIANLATALTGRVQALLATARNRAAGGD